MNQELGSDDVVSYCIAHKLGVALCAKRRPQTLNPLQSPGIKQLRIVCLVLHDLVGSVHDVGTEHLLKGHRPGCHIQTTANLLHYFSFRKQSQNFPLSFRKAFCLWYQFFLLPA